MVRGRRTCITWVAPSPPRRVGHSAGDPLEESLRFATFVYPDTDGFPSVFSIFIKVSQASRSVLPLLVCRRGRSAPVAIGDALDRADCGDDGGWCPITDQECDPLTLV